jgi:hypothetical protein
MGGFEIVGVLDIRLEDNRVRRRKVWGVALSVALYCGIERGFFPTVALFKILIDI